MDAGFEPDAFWHQSPQSFEWAMEGARKRREREIEHDLGVAWHMAAFGGAVQSKGGLKPLKYYLARRGGAQSPEEMLHALRTLGSGSDMKIRRVAANEEAG